MSLSATVASRVPERVRRHHGLLLPAAVTATAAAAAAVVATVDPNQPGHYPTCPFLYLTGWWCPGCGALRACHDLLHLDLAGALARNPLTVLALPFLLTALVLLWRRGLGRPVPSATSLPPWSLYAVLALVIVYGVLRNLPGWTLLSPA